MIPFYGKHLPDEIPVEGIGEAVAQGWFEEQISARSTDLGDAVAFAHMDPPPATVAATLVGLNARYNQNLLHPDLSPFASEAERILIGWLCPAFGMRDGHLCSGSTIANLAALWAAREQGAQQVIASDDAHISIGKAAHLLGLPLKSVPVDSVGRLDRDALSGTESAVLVLTAGTTGRGVIDELNDRMNARWVHVDAAWAGPLRLTSYKHLLNGIESADSVAVSAHKWLYQPKDSALVFFADPEVHSSISFGGSYLTTPNVGVQGSRGAAAIPLLATLLAWGREGLEHRISKNMLDAETLANLIAADPRLELKQMPETAVLNWRPRRGNVSALQARLDGTASKTLIDDELWIRQVAANPFADTEAIWLKILANLEEI